VVAEVGLTLADMKAINRADRETVTGR